MIQNNYNLCVECNEGIFNPVCPRCIMNQVTEGLRLNIKERKRILKIKIDDIKGERCIICKKNAVSMCPYCFTEKIYKELKKIGNKRLLKEFFIYFDYDFERTGYGKEKENYI